MVDERQATQGRERNLLFSYPGKGLEKYREFIDKIDRSSLSAGSFKSDRHSGPIFILNDSKFSDLKREIVKKTAYVYDGGGEILYLYGGYDFVVVVIMSD